MALTVIASVSSTGAIGPRCDITVAMCGAMTDRTVAHGVKACTMPGMIGAMFDSACPRAGISRSAMAISPGVACAIAWPTDCSPGASPAAEVSPS